MKNFAKMKDVFLGAFLALALLFAGVFLTACGNKYDGFEITLSDEVITLSIVDGVCQPQNVIVTIEGDASISREVDVSSDATQLNLSQVMNDQGQTVITVTASAVCSGASVVIKTLEGGKTASFAVNVVVPVKMISPSSEAQGLFVVRGQVNVLSGEKIVAFEPENTTQKQIDFAVVTETPYARVENNVLVIDEEYAADTIALRATSPYVSGSEILLTATVLPKLSEETVRIEEIKYLSAELESVYEAGEGATLPEKVELSNNLAEKQSLRFVVSVKSSEVVTISPFVKSTMGLSSDVVSFSTGHKIEVPDVAGNRVETQYTFVLSSQGIMATDEVFFKVSFSEFDYEYQTAPLKVEVRDSVNKIELFVDDEKSNQTEFVVYNVYQNKKGLKFGFGVLPTTVTEEEKTLVLEMGVNAQAYQYWVDDSETAINDLFVDGKFEFSADKPFYVSARTSSELPAQIKVYAKANPAVKQVINLTAGAGTTMMKFVNASETDIGPGGEEIYFYNLKSNDVMGQIVKFASDTTDISGIEVEVSGDAVVVTSLPMAKNDYFQFGIASVKGKEGTSVLTLRQKNGYFVQAYIRVIHELVRSEVVFTVPSPQVNAAVGYMERQNAADWQFRVAITYGNSVTLGRSGEGIVNVSYRYSDYLLTDETRDGYSNYFDRTQDNLANLTFVPTSQVLDARFLALDQLKPKAIGQTWVEAKVIGQKLTENVVGEESQYILAESVEVFYFLVEGYVPVTELALSTYSVNLYSQASVGFSDYALTEETVELELSDATYQDISWLNVASLYQVEHGKNVYAAELSQDQRKLKITALATWQMVDGKAVLMDSVDFVFVAVVKEFNKEYRLAVNVTIKRAQQVEKILALNASSENGIYIPLNFDGQAVVRDIEAVVQVGESGKMPFNTSLVFEFLPFATAGATSVSLNRETGRLTIAAGATVGDAGVIRIAPADRYDAQNKYAAPENDVAVYIRLVIADGNSRETSYRVTSIEDILKIAPTAQQRSRMHFTLMNDITLRASDMMGENVAFATTFSGGLYGALEGENRIATITTERTLFGTLTEKACVADLQICGEVMGSAFVAGENNGTIDNVHVVAINNQTTYATPSVLNVLATTSNVGGLVALNGGKIVDSAFSGQILGEELTGLFSVGGIAGENLGTIDKCCVEFCVYKNAGYDMFNVGGAVLGGLVGKMSQGALTNSYVQSYVPLAKASTLLKTIGRYGTLLGDVYGGAIDVCFANVQNHQNMYGSLLTATNTLIKNAYVTYRASDEAELFGKFIVGFNEIVYTGDKSVLDVIVSDEIWDTSGGLPTFKDVKAGQSVSQISQTFVTSESVFSDLSENGQASLAVMFVWDFGTGLTEQEKMVRDSMNFYAFEELFEDNAGGLRAFSDNPNVVRTSASGLVLVGCGVANITFYSKYNAEISRVFTIYVISPVVAPKFDLGAGEFANGYTINIKATGELAFAVLVDNQKLLDARNIEFKTTQTNLIFSSPAITGQGNGPFSVNANALIEGNNQIEYVLEVWDTGADAEVNKLLNSKFDGVFTINVYKGADKIEISNSDIVMEPFDRTEIEVTLYSDVSLADGEGVSVIQEANAAFGQEVFNVLTECVDVKFFANKDMTEIAPEADAKYYVYKFRISFVVKDECRALEFGQTEFVFTISAKTAINNGALYGNMAVAKQFYLTVNSQEILSVTTNHYDKTNKSVLYDEDKEQNYVFYQFNTQVPSNILAPGEEGLLKLELYPNYARYDYIDLTYKTTTGEDMELVLGLMEEVINPKNGAVGYRNTSANMAPLENGIRILNVESLSSEPITTIFVGTYLPLTATKDTVFELTLSAYSGESVTKQTTFNLVVEYMQDAVINVVDGIGNALTAIARGGQAELLVTLPKEDNLTLERINVLGVKNTDNPEGHVSLLRTAILEDEFSLTRTYKYSLITGAELELENEANYITIEVEFSWLVGGKLQQKTSTYTLGVVDFMIENIQLLTDKTDKATFYSYIGVQSNLQFDFDGKSNSSTNKAFRQFLSNYYYENLSLINSYGDYIVNVGNRNASSFLGNLYYVEGNRSYPLLNQDGTYEANNYFAFTESDGVIRLTGKRQGQVNLRFVMQIQYPNKMQNTLYEVAFDFVVEVRPFSDEDLPLIIDNEDAFLDALTSGEAQDYILMNDLYLYDYTPFSTDAIASLDGNNHTIHIMSWGASEGGEINLALFDEVVDTTTLKNVTVNLYHAPQIVVDSSVVTEVNVAGFALTNNGLVYNCAVVSYATAKGPTGAGGIRLDFGDWAGQNIQTKVAGFVIINGGYITNSRVGGVMLEKIASGTQRLEIFRISSQGTISGFVDTNSGTVASSFFANGTITNTTNGALQTTSSGFVNLNTGKIFGSYAKGTGDTDFSLTGEGITTSGVSAGFVANNSGVVLDSYSNILLASPATAENEALQTGRLSAGFVHSNQGTIENAYTASRIENAKTTQMAFVGVDDSGKLLNTGTITHGYYYTDASIDGDAYSSMTADLNVVRISEPNNPDKFYGLSFADSASSMNGVWFSTGYGIDLVSANQIAVSGRYVANEKRDDITGELLSYNLPYFAGYEYGSVKNPIIIRSAAEFNRASGGDDEKAGVAISNYYSLGENTMFGNYRLVTDINLKELNPDNTQAVSTASTEMTLRGGVIDGNHMTISGIDITAQTDSIIQSFGLFRALEDGACIKNLTLEIVAVSAKQARFVGALAGQVTNSKVVGVTVRNQTANSVSSVLGNNVVGGLVGLVQGDSEVKNIEVDSISIKANALATGTAQNYARNLSEIITVNSGISYAGGVIGVADIFLENEKNSSAHKTDTEHSSLTNILAKGQMQVRASTVGGIMGYTGPQTNVRDSGFEVGAGLSARLVAYNFYAGGIVGENHGNLDMVTAEHEKTLQKTIENSVSTYYRNPENTQVERGHLNLFDDTSDGEVISTYEPIAIGGLVGAMMQGDIQHSYSKINVRNQAAKYAGGVIGEISKISSPQNERNKVNLFEVYAFGDVAAGAEGAGVGGIVGFVDINRKVSMAKVNAVNYWTVEYNAQTEKFALPENAYSIYAKTTLANGQEIFVDEAVNYNQAENKTTLKSGYALPTISATNNNDDMFAVTAVKFNQGGKKENQYVKQSFACLMGDAPYNMVFDPYYGLSDEEKASTEFVSTQSITPYYDLTDVKTNGIAMDTYFIQANWDTNYWVRYSETEDLLPSLVTYSESMSYYIDVAEDLQKMVYHPYATFIVRALGQPSTIIPVGTYIENSGISLNNFAGTLKGLDATQNYGFDFEGRSSFIKATTGASFYSLTLKGLGKQGDFTTLNQAFVDTATLTTFENMTIKNSYATTEVNESNANVGILTNKMVGGYLSDISFENCAINVKMQSGLTSAAVPVINVGMVAGQLATNGTTLMQMTDVLAYQTPGKSWQNNGTNNINIDLSGATLLSTEINAGALSGETLGNVVSTYTSTSTKGMLLKGMGVASSSTEKYNAGSSQGIVNGTKIALVGTGSLKEFNAGIMFGKVNTMTVSFNRQSQAEKLQIVGGVVQSADMMGNYATVANANVGGVIGKVETTASIINSASQRQKFIETDVVLMPRANVVNAGGLIGLASSIYNIDNIDTFGLISANAGVEGAIGGVLGEVNSNLGISNVISKMSLVFNGQKAVIGGLVGKYSATSGQFDVGEGEYNTKFAGEISVKAQSVAVGGILGGAMDTANDSYPVKVNLLNVVYGGDIVLGEVTGNLFAGGLVGQTKLDGSESTPVVEIKDSLSYGTINLKYNYLGKMAKSMQVAIGGLVGQASETTTLSGNTSLVTLSSKTSSTLTGVNINALVGDGSAITGTAKGKNYYSHQISLCLDLNTSDIGATNLYYNRTDETLPAEDAKSYLSIADVLEGYVEQLTNDEINDEYYKGSKLNPYKVASEEDLAVLQDTVLSAPKTVGKTAVVLVTRAFTTSRAGTDLVACQIVGDGYEIISNHALFGHVDEDSSISGVCAVPSINGTNASVANNGLSGSGAIANVNDGFVFGCSVKANTKIDGNKPSFSANNIVVSGGAYTGGLVGVNTGTIMDSMASVNISAGANAGGVVGYNAGHVISCYSVGSAGAGYAFGTGNGEVYSSYTASSAQQGVFGTAQTVVDSFYDLYATTVSDTNETTSDTNTMAVLDTLEGKTLMFASVTQAKKMAYTLGVNFGYPTFSGPAYNSFKYMQGIDTGTGTKNDPFMINSVGKLQQTSFAQDKTLSYLLVADIKVTGAMQTKFDEMKNAENVAHFDKTFEVVDWAPIEDFKGTLSGQNPLDASKVYTISGLKTRVANDIWGIWGTATGATLENFEVEYADLSVPAHVLGGVVGKLDGSTVTNVDFTANSVKSSVVGSASVGGLFGVVSATAQENNISDCDVTLVSVGAVESVSEANIGGFVGEMLDGTYQTTFSGIRYTSGLSVTVNASTVMNVGGFVGKAVIGEVVGAEENLTIENVELLNVTVTAEGNGKQNLGGAFGDVTNVDEGMHNFTLGNVAITSNATSELSAGALVGLAQDSFFDNSGNDAITLGGASIVMNGSGKLLAGGIAGTAKNTTIANMAIGVTIENSQAGKSVIGGVVGQMSGGELVLEQFDLKDLAIKLTSETNEQSHYLGGLVGEGLSGATVKGGNGDLEVISTETGGGLALENKGTGASMIGGVFGMMSGANLESAEISGLVLEGAYVGAVSGQIQGGSASDVTVKTCKITGLFVGAGTSVVARAGAVSAVIQGGATLSDVVIDGGSVQTEEVPSGKTPKSHLGAFAGEFVGTMNGSNSSSAEIKTVTGGYVGGAIGTTTGESTISGLKVTGSVTANLDKSQKGQTLEVGGIAGHFNGTISSSEHTGGTVSANAPAYVGGIAGWASGKLLGVSVTGDVEEDNEYETQIVPMNTAVGGLVGKASTLSLEGSTVLAGSNVLGTYIAGGLVGEAISSTFEAGNINAATVEAGVPNQPETDIMPAIPYAGGIVGKMTGGSIANCENNGTVKAGWRVNGGTKLTQRDMFYLGKKNFQNYDDEADSNLTLNKIKSKVTAFNAAQKGSEESYAGGIVGNADSSVVIRAVTNAAPVTASAKLRLHLTSSSRYDPSGLLNWNMTDTYAHYAKETEKAYAAGVSGTEVTISDEANCKNTGVIVGGGVVEYNIYTDDDGDVTNVYKSYILGYKFNYAKDGTKSYIQNSFEDIYMDDEENVKAWVEKQSDPGMKLVASDRATNQYYKYGDTGYPGLTAWDNDLDRLVYRTAYLTEEEYADNVDLSTLQYDYLYYGAMAGDHEFKAGETRFKFYTPPASIIDTEVAYGGVSVYFTAKNISPGTQATTLLATGLYYEILKKERIEYGTPYQDPETEEWITPEIVVIDYNIYTPMWNGHGYDVIEETVTSADPRYSYLNSRYTSGLTYGEATLEKQFVIHAVGGICSFPDSDNLETQKYSYDLAKGGQVFMAGGAEQITFTLTKSDIRAFDLDVVYNKTDEQNVVRQTVFADSEFDGDTNTDNVLKWGDDATLDAEYGPPTSYDTGRVIWKIVMAEVTETPYLHWGRYEGFDVLYYGTVLNEQTVVYVAGQTGAAKYAYNDGAYYTIDRLSEAGIELVQIVQQRKS